MFSYSRQDVGLQMRIQEYQRPRVYLCVGGWVCVHAQLSCIQLFATLWTVACQERIPEWIAISFSMRSSQPRDEPPISCVSCTGRHVLYHWHPLGSPMMCVCAQLCLTLCNPMDCSPAGSSVHGILSARTLECIAISSSTVILG